MRVTKAGHLLGHSRMAHREKLLEAHVGGHSVESAVNMRAVVSKRRWGLTVLAATGAYLKVRMRHFRLHLSASKPCGYSRSVHIGR